MSTNPTVNVVKMVKKNPRSNNRSRRSGPEASTAPGINMSNVKLVTRGGTIESTHVSTPVPVVSPQMERKNSGHAILKFIQSLHTSLPKQKTNKVENDTATNVTVQDDNVKVSAHRAVSPGMGETHLKAQKKKKAKPKGQMNVNSKPDAITNGVVASELDEIPVALQALVDNSSSVVLTPKAKKISDQSQSQPSSSSGNKFAWSKFQCSPDPKELPIPSFILNSGKRSQTHQQIRTPSIPLLKQESKIPIQRSQSADENVVDGLNSTSSLTEFTHATAADASQNSAHKVAESTRRSVSMHSDADGKARSHIGANSDSPRVQLLLSTFSKLMHKDAVSESKAPDGHLAQRDSNPQGVSSLKNILGLSSKS